MMDLSKLERYECDWNGIDEKPDGDWVLFKDVEKLNQESYAWINTEERLPSPGMLIVKRWKNGSVWAGRYAGSTKDSSFDYWLQLEEKVGV